MTDNFDLNAFEKNQSTYLAKMDMVVSKMAVLSNKKLNLVIYIEIIFAILSLLLIFYEIIFVFKKINNRLRLKNDQLTASNELLENYAYLAAHNLRSPIQNILNFGNLLKEKIGANSALANKYLNFILESGEDLDQTTKELLYFSQLNNTKLQFEACDPKEIIEKSISSLDKKINEIDAKITYSNLPRSIIADQILLKLAFQNLISNGIKFSKKNNKTYY